MKIKYKPLFQNNFFKLVKSDIELQKEIEKEIENIENRYNQKNYRIKNIVFFDNDIKVNGFIYDFIPRNSFYKPNSNDFRFTIYFSVEKDIITLFDIVFN